MSLPCSSAADAFNQPLDSWRVGAVTNMYSMYNMFYLAKEFNQPLNSWRVDVVTQKGYMF